MDEQIVMNWYPNSSPDRMTGYGSIVGRMTLAEIADWCATHGIDPTVVTVNGNVRTSRRYTDEELMERERRHRAYDERNRDWEIKTLRRLAEKYPETLADPG
jgi:aryl-alcohol dehydrogenase-like predicted oxidoreductase